MSLADTEALEARHAAEGGEVKRAYVRRMFSEIAPRYDLLNHVLSFNIDRRWRAAALEELAWRERPSGRFLDLCAGTLDVGTQLVRQHGFRGMVISADFSEPMLRAGNGKAPRAVLSPVAADALDLPLGAGAADGAVVAFGIRNVANLDAALVEVYRVLSPGARFVILEFSTPQSAVVRGMYHAYFHHVLPLIGRLISGHRTAYQYLPESVAHFPEQRALAERLERAGFENVRWRSLTFGVAALHTGTKPAPRL
jgi:demethylmenaquinone methyltransferase / 2-methoxy-6-polyprenyl-1,4-benzoquinol methylase